MVIQSARTLHFKLRSANEDTYTANGRQNKRELERNSLRDRQRNEWIEQRTNITDTIKEITLLKLDYGGHVTQRNGKMVTINRRRGGGRPITFG